MSSRKQRKRLAERAAKLNETKKPKKKKKGEPK